MTDRVPGNAEDEVEAREVPEYCSQNAGDCWTCSLVNYGKDCNNNPI
ncbi:MAG: hypothetical protein ACMUJM_25260 [bacterium]